MKQGPVRMGSFISVKNDVIKGKVWRIGVGGKIFCSKKLSAPSIKMSKQRTKISALEICKSSCVNTKEIIL